MVSVRLTVIMATIKTNIEYFLEQIIRLRFDHTHFLAIYLHASSFIKSLKRIVNFKIGAKKE